MKLGLEYSELQNKIHENMPVPSKTSPIFDDLEAWECFQDNVSLILEFHREVLEGVREGIL